MTRNKFVVFLDAPIKVLFQWDVRLGLNDSNNRTGFWTTLAYIDMSSNFLWCEPWSWGGGAGLCPSAGEGKKEKLCVACRAKRSRGDSQG